MEIIENPSYELLDEIQQKLADERNLGIVEIWCCSNPYYILAVESGESVGVLSMSLNGHFAEIYKLYVPAQYRRRGYAKKLFHMRFHI